MSSFQSHSPLKALVEDYHHLQHLGGRLPKSGNPKLKVSD